MLPSKKRFETDFPSSREKRTGIGADEIDEQRPLHGNGQLVLPANRDDPVHLLGLLEALGPHLADAVDVDQVADVFERGLRDQDLAAQRVALDAGGEVDGAADRGVLRSLLRTEIPHDDVAGRDADAHLDRRGAPARGSSG